MKHYTIKKRHCEIKGHHCDPAFSAGEAIHRLQGLHFIINGLLFPKLLDRKDVLVLLLLLYSLSSFATIITVKQDGTGNFTTIQAGIDAASNSDTVLVWPGTYFENIDYNSKSITVASRYLTTGIQDYINTTIIDGANNGSCVDISNCTGNNTTLCGFTLQHGSGYSNLKKGGAIYIDGSTAIIYKCTIINNTARDGGGIYCRNSQVELLGNIIKNNLSLVRGGGLFVSSGTDIQFNETFPNSIFLNHSANGMDIASTTLNTPALNIVLDTFTVQKPDQYFIFTFDDFGYPVNNYTFQCFYSKILTVNSNLYVSPEGDNENSGSTPDEPLKTICYALEKTLPDSINPKTIYLLPGTYSFSSNDEKLPIAQRSFVSIHGSDLANTIVDGEYLFPLYYSQVYNLNFDISDIHFIRGIDSQAVIKDFGGLEFFDNDSITLQNICISETKGGARSGLNSALSSIKIKNSKIINNSGDYPLVLGNTGSMLKTMSVINSIIEYNGPGITYDQGYGGAVGFFGSYSYPDATRGRVINTQINENTLTFEPGAGDKPICGLSCTQYATVDVINSSIANNIVTNPESSAQVYAAEGAEINFYNSIVYGTEDYEIFLGDGTPTSDIATVNISNTDVKGGQENIQNWNNIHVLNWLDGNIDEDPQFTGSGDFPYSLQPGSPCINAGVPMYEEGMDYPYIKEEGGKYVLYMLEGDTVTLPATDLAGNPRISGGKIDMGAYEWQDTTTDIPDSKIQNPTLGLQVYPNPFTSNLFISFSLPEACFINLEAISMKGGKIRTIASNRFPAGDYRLVWDGKDDTGFDLKTGTYLVCLYLDGKLVGCEKVMRRE